MELRCNLDKVKQEMHTEFVWNSAGK